MNTALPNPKIALLGGMDPTGGAGILRDAWVCRAIAPDLRVQVLCTALTRQGGVDQPASVRCLPGPGFGAELRRMRGAVWKVGMLPSPCVRPLLEHLEGGEGPATLVLDPVQRASAGGRLGAFAEELALLWRHCTWVTPNAEEARALGARPGLSGEPWQLSSSMRDAKAWWIKSASQDEKRICDELHLEGEVFSIQWPRRAGPDPRGTGCALASALASYVVLDERLAWDAFETQVQRWNGRRWSSDLGSSLTQLRFLGSALAASRWLAKARAQARVRGSQCHLPLRLSS